LTVVREMLSVASARQSRDASIVLVAEGTVAERLARVLEEDDLCVTIRAPSPERLTKAAGDPAVVVYATSALGPERADPVSSLRTMFPTARLVIVTPSATLRTARALIADRVDGLVLENDVEHCLGLAVRSVVAGQISFPLSLRSKVARPALSPREKQVLGMVVLGFTNREIASKLHLAESTVKSHLSSSFSKLEVRSRSEAAALILDPELGLGTGILAISDD